MYSHKEQLSLHLPQKFVATDDNSALRTEMLSLEPQEENVKPLRHLHWNPRGWLGKISTRGLTDSWHPSLWQTFVCSAFGEPSPP